MVEGILALAATLAALAGTGLLVVRTSKEPRPELIAWSLALVGLTIALGAMAIGLLFGFGTGLFRAMEFGGAVIAPVWLAVGMVVLISQVVQVRFATWLVAISYTVVATVIVLLDPVQGKFGSGLPKPGEHYEVIPLGLIDGAHIIAVITLVGCAGFTAWRARDLQGAGFELLMQVALGALAGVLVVAGTRGFLPGALAVIALGGATGLVWFGAQKMSALQRSADGEDSEGESAEDYGTGYDQGPHTGYEDGAEQGYDEAAYSEAAYGEAAYSEAAYGEAAYSEAAYSDGVHDDGVHDDGAYDDSTHEDMVAGPLHGPQEDFVVASQSAPGTPGAPAAPQGQFANDGAGVEKYALGPVAGRSQTGANALPGAALSGPPTSVPVGPVPGAAPGAPTGLRFSGPEPLSAPLMSSTAASPPTSVPVGQVVVYTLQEGAERLFDRLAEEAVRAAREHEPDLLVFTLHEVTATRTQRILYRLFRDQPALDAHERQPHIQRFVAESRSAVLATNVVDLRLSAAKVVPLPSFLTRDLP